MKVKRFAMLIALLFWASGALATDFVMTVSNETESGSPATWGLIKELYR